MLKWNYYKMKHEAVPYCKIITLVFFLLEVSGEKYR
jgi:hypothetical protein